MSMEGLKDLWCGWFHGGGTVQRDDQYRLNWRCSKCGRWAMPLSQEAEKRLTDKAIKGAKP